MLMAADETLERVDTLERVEEERSQQVVAQKSKDLATAQKQLDEEMRKLAEVL